MTALPAIFSPEPSDNEDVVSALETADIFWTKGDTDEALRWLKRAAETASDAGDDIRALAIARSAADLKSGNGSSPTSGTVEVSTIRKSRPPTPPSSHSKHPPPAPSTAASASGGNGRMPSTAASHKSPPPLPPSKPRESVAPSPPSKASAIPPAHNPSGASAARTASTDRLQAISTESRAAPVRASTPAPTSVPAVADAPAKRTASPSTLPKEPQRALTPATAYRAITVYVRPQGQNGDKLEVIIAKPGQPVPAGAEPAILVPTRRGGRLLG